MYRRLNEDEDFFTDSRKGLYANFPAGAPDTTSWEDMENEDIAELIVMKDYSRKTPG